jgi:single-strand selective monofunctional uracil DNA glycosylase
MRPSHPIHPIYFELNKQMNALIPSLLVSPIEAVYNPLDYAGAMHESYLETYCPKERGSILFMGMNPGPDGMGQTGIPFGSVPIVRDYLRLDVPIHRPPLEHPKKPVLGLDCPKTEPSGKRLWGLIEEDFPNPYDFFRDYFVINYCPLLFLGPRGSNIATSVLKKDLQALFLTHCDHAVQKIIQLLQPRALVGIGAYAAQAFRRIEPTLPVTQILHPSPASPLANKDWKGTVRAHLQSKGLWK